MPPLRVRYRRWLGPLAAASFVVSAAVAGLWVRTELLGWRETIVWGGPGWYRSVELSGDDVKIHLLVDPGLPATPLAWDSRRRSSRPAPPRPSNPAALPATSVTWVLPRPRDALALAAGVRSHGPAQLGFEYATFPGWYGPGTWVRVYRLSYFAILLPAVVLPVLWAARAGLRRWRHGRFPAGHCRWCGYDLRATPGRCPECGTEPAVGAA